jgi:hypothetical protein
MKQTPAMLAKQMERAGKDCFRYQNEHCTVFENDLEQICPRNDDNRKKKLVEFAAQYGFRLRFYRKGLFASFGKRTLASVNNKPALWPAVACAGSNAK